MKLYELKEKCMAATKKGIRCKHNGTERHVEGSTRYAVCGQHAEMLVKGEHVAFVAHITATNVAAAVNQNKLPGLDTNVEMAREALEANNPNEITVEVFYVRGLEPNKVLCMHKETTKMSRWSKSTIMRWAVEHMPNIEGKITGLMVRSGNNKAVWNRKPNGWVERPVPTNLSIVINNTNA